MATYTRTAFSRAAWAEHRFEMFVLPLLVLCTLITLYNMFGVWIYLSLYLYAQWFHFLRQSYGISRMYRAKSKQPITDEGLTKAVIYAVPFWGIVQWSVMAPETYLSFPVKFFNVPDILDPISGIVAVTTIVLWSYSRYKMWKAKTLPVPHTIYDAE